MKEFPLGYRYRAIAAFVINSKSRNESSEANEYLKLPGDISYFVTGLEYQKAKKKKIVDMGT